MIACFSTIFPTVTLKEIYKERWNKNKETDVIITEVHYKNLQLKPVNRGINYLSNDTCHMLYTAIRKTTADMLRHMMQQIK
jgi:hypothetical protein